MTTLLGQNVGDLQKARSHPTISSWLRSLNTSALGELGLDTDIASPTGLARSTTGTPDATPWASHLAHTSGQLGNDAPTSGMPQPGLPSWAPLSPPGPVCPGPPQTPDGSCFRSSHPASYSVGQLSPLCLLG